MQKTVHVYLINGKDQAASKVLCGYRLDVLNASKFPFYRTNPRSISDRTFSLEKDYPGPGGQDLYYKEFISNNPEALTKVTCDVCLFHRLKYLQRTR